MDDMSVEKNGGMKFAVGENGRNPAKNPPRPHFVHHETHMEGPRRELGTPTVGGERLTACTTRPPKQQNTTTLQLCNKNKMNRQAELYKIEKKNITFQK